jgi:type II secretory pathway component PulF
MPDFAYQALTQSQELETGQISAAHVAEAVALLEAQGLEIQMIRQVDSAEESASRTAQSSLHGGPSWRALEYESELLRDRIDQLLQQRDTLAPALTAFAEELPTGRPRRELTRLAARLGEGATADDLSQSPEMTAAWIPLLSGGASLGSKNFLHDLFAETSRDSAVRTQRTRVLAYPLLVFALAMLVLILLCVTVVPGFSSMFDDFGMELPGLSRLIIDFSNEIRFHPGRFVTLLLLFPPLCLFLIQLVIATGVPGFLFGGLTKGNSRQVSAMASFIRRLAELLQAGFPLPMSLRLAGRASGRGRLKREAMSLAEKTESGAEKPWSSKFPPTLLYALRAGPGGGPNIRLLQELAELYAERVRARFDWSSGFVPQLAILAVGFVVAIVVLALYLPLVELVNGLSG